MVDTAALPLGPAHDDSFTELAGCHCQRIPSSSIPAAVFPLKEWNQEIEAGTEKGLICSFIHSFTRSTYSLSNLRRVLGVQK